MGVILSLISESNNINIDTSTFKLKNGSTVPVVIKSTKFNNPNDKISGNGVKLDFFVDNKKIGNASISGIDSNMPFMYGFEVNSKYRGLGYGTAILQYCIKQYKVNDLSVSISNKNAVRLYEKHGFKKRFNYKDDGETLMYMQIHKRGYENR